MGKSHLGTHSAKVIPKLRDTLAFRKMSARDTLGVRFGEGTRTDSPRLVNRAKDLFPKCTTLIDQALTRGWDNGRIGVGLLSASTRPCCSSVCCLSGFQGNWIVIYQIMNENMRKTALHTSIEAIEPWLVHSLSLAGSVADAHAVSYFTGQARLQSSQPIGFGRPSQLIKE